MPWRGEQRFRAMRVCVDVGKDCQLGVRVSYAHRYSQMGISGFFAQSKRWILLRPGLQTIYI